MITHNLFPTPVSAFTLDRELTKEELDFLSIQEEKPNEGNTTSANRTILDNENLSSLRKFIEESLDTYFKGIFSPKNKVSLRFTQSWTNYTKPGQYHHKHAHPNSLVSGVFYVKANKDSDKIYFYRDGYRQLKIPVDQWNLYNSESWWLPVNTGDLYIFPSSLTHMVETVQGDDTRISLAFNTFPVGNVGDDDSLTGLYL